MDSTLKQRILGIFILLALLGFCLTILLHNNKNSQPRIAPINTNPPITQTTNAMLSNNSQNVFVAKPTPIPAPTVVTPAPAPVVAAPVPVVQQKTVVAPAPVVKPVSIPTPAPTIVAAPKPVAVAKDLYTLPAKQKATKIIKQKTKAEPRSMSGAVVQVGTFSLNANAETLVQKLHKAGFNAKAEKINTAKGKMTRVIVGHKNLDHAQAKILRDKLKNKMNLTGIII